MSSNQWEAEQGTKQHAHTNAVRALGDAKREAHEAIVEADYAGAPPLACLINSQPPTMNDLRPGGSPSWGQNLAYAHATTFRLWREARPYRKNNMEIWETPLVELPWPTVSTDLRSISQPYGGSYKQSTITYTKKTPSLETLHEYNFADITLKCEYEDTYSGGTTVQERSEKVFLPIYGCDAAWNQLTDFLDEINLLAEIRQQREHDVAPMETEWEVEQ